MVRTLNKTILESAERNCSRIIIDSGANINASSSLHFRKDKAAKNPQDQLKIRTGSGKALSSGTAQIRCELGSFSSAVLPALRSDTELYQCPDCRAREWQSTVQFYFAGTTEKSGAQMNSS